MSREYVLEAFRAPLKLQIDYEHELNEQQLAAVTAPPGPSLVIAGAGSGKTRTLTYRVAFLLEQGIPPERILLLTFTNKAAREMMRRVTDLLGHELSALWGGTFHSIGNRILRQHANLLGYTRNFTILDREDARHLIKTCIAESKIDAEDVHFPKPETVAEIFSLAVNTGKSIAQVMETDYRKHTEAVTQLAKLQERYAVRKRANNAMDFDDLLARWLKLLQEQQEVREQYQRRFQFILVDEYQDTNVLQSELIDLLAARHHNLMVVGDDAQSIYAWRGANFLNIFEFPKRYPEAKIYKIETNYRSTPEILEVANAAILANEHQFTKELAPSRRAGDKPGLVTCQDASQQAAFVAQRVVQLCDEGYALNRMAVLYRSHFHALELQLELTRRRIPFSITSGIRFFEQAHLKDVIAWLRFVINPRDELSFKRIVQLMRGIGGKAAEKLWAAFSGAEGAAAPGQARTSAADTVNQGADSGSRETPSALKLQACAAVVPKKAAVAWAQFVATIAQLEDPELRGNPAGMIRTVVDAGYEDYLKDKFSNYASRLDDVEQIGVFARQFSSVEDLLSQLALLTNLEAEQDRPAADDDEKLRLSTIHQAKGLEFDVVFVIMLCEGLFPSSRAFVNPEQLEEERRLMYVAITRARNELYLSYPLMRAGFGEQGALVQKPSRFLQEIPSELLEDWKLTV